MSLGVGKDLKVLLDRAKDRGWKVSLTNGGHVRAEYGETGEVVTTSYTPSDPRANKNFLADMRRIERNNPAPPEPEKVTVSHYPKAKLVRISFPISQLPKDIAQRAKEKKIRMEVFASKDGARFWVQLNSYSESGAVPVIEGRRLRIQTTTNKMGIRTALQFPRFEAIPIPHPSSHKNNRWRVEFPQEWIDLNNPEGTLPPPPPSEKETTPHKEESPAPVQREKFLEDLREGIDIVNSLVEDLPPNYEAKFYQDENGQLKCKVTREV